MFRKTEAINNIQLVAELYLPRLSAAQKSQYKAWPVHFAPRRKFRKRRQSTPSSLENAIQPAADPNAKTMNVKKAKQRIPNSRKTFAASSLLDSGKSHSQRSIGHRDQKGRLSRGKKQNRNVHSDPDDDFSQMAMTSDEDMIEAIKTDHPETFQVESRLRGAPKVTLQQCMLRKLKKKRLGIVESSTESGTTDDEGSQEENPLQCIDSDVEYENGGIKRSGGSRTGDNDPDDFIVEDDHRIPEDMPVEFSRNSYQSLEFKFRIVFHYLLFIIMHPDVVLDKKGREYFERPLRDVRRKMQEYQNNTRGQIWNNELVNKLKKYPIFRVTNISPEDGCDACRLPRTSTFQILLEGEPYDNVTLQPKKATGSGHRDSNDDNKCRDSSDEDDERRDSDLVSRKSMPNRLIMERAHIFHELVHWEYNLYHQIQSHYHHLLSAAKYKKLSLHNVLLDQQRLITKIGDVDDDFFNGYRKKNGIRKVDGRIDGIIKKGLPDDVANVDDVMRWMNETAGYVSAEYRQLEALIETAAKLEGNR
nr:hypothetical protein L203_02749 [Cryptococcus depauperatus CBS 7841]